MLPFVIGFSALLGASMASAKCGACGDVHGVLGTCAAVGGIDAILVDTAEIGVAGAGRVTGPAFGSGQILPDGIGLERFDSHGRRTWYHVDRQHGRERNRPSPGYMFAANP